MGLLNRLANAILGSASDLIREQKVVRRTVAQPRHGRGAKTYSVGLVGESHYQHNIRLCFPGQAVTLLREPNNPYDRQAIAAVVGPNQLTIGYIARDSFIQRLAHDEERGCRASIKSIRSGAKGLLGVVVDVTLCDEQLGEREFER